MARQALPLICVATVLAIGALGVDAGYINGDAAVYAHQGAQWDLGQRWVHLGWIALAAALSPAAGPHLPAWMDAAHVIAAASIPWSMSRLALPRSAGLAAVIAVVAMLPWASGAEVDVPTVALMLGAAGVRSWLSVVLAGCALTLSPGAVLLLPSVVTVRWCGERSWWPPVLGVMLGVGALSAVSSGAWWWGDRGVLSDPSMHVGRTAREALWGLSPAALIAAIASGARRSPSWRSAVLAVSVVPLLIAPSDSQLWLGFLVMFPAIASSTTRSIAATPARSTPAARETDRPSNVVIFASCTLAMLWSVAHWGLATRHRAEQTAMIDQIAADLGPDDGLIAPWTLGVRISLRATGDPYGLRWRKPNGFVRDQQARWTPPPKRVVTVD